MIDNAIEWVLDHLGVIMICMAMAFFGFVVGNISGGTSTPTVRVVHDDTDPPNGSSHMMPFTDNLTGCQYLGRSNGGPTVARTDITGKQVGCRPYVGR